MSSEKIGTLAKLLEEILLEEQQKDKTINLDDISFVKFEAGSGNGILWKGKKHTKQLVFNTNPDRLFSSESINIAKGKNYNINNIGVLSEEALGETVVKSNLKQVGRLKGLVVDGGLNVNQFLYYDAAADRLGLGTENPNASLSIVDGNVELIFGAGENFNVGNIGTFNSADFALVTDETERLTIKAGGDIELGNKNFGPIKVSVHGTISAGVNTVDPRATLHVSGAIKFNDNLHTSNTSPPAGGSYSVGDVVWNSRPQPKSYVGWVCTKSGNPGEWSPFGQIS